ncbi:DUF3962 domain-containing protein [Bacillus cytotoxicus]|uniref:pPIWI_RE module domain-containing protein n=1 Tax=Bacillus cytotoxicus TaxID=580165 RepID=UPI002FE565DC
METIQLLAFKDVIDPLFEQTVFYVQWPKHWSSLLLEHNRPYELIKKFKLLNKRLYIMFSDILFIEHDPYKLAEDSLWIICLKPLSSEQLEYICRQWYAYIHNWKPTEMPGEVLLEWQPSAISKLSLLHDKKTFYIWVPALISHLFCERALYLSIGNKQYEEIPFYPLREQHRCEAMSEPIQDKKTKEYFSYIYRFELITRGIENMFLLKVSIGKRRFYQTANQYANYMIMKKRKGTVLVSNCHNEKDKFVTLKIEDARFGVNWSKAYRELQNVFMLKKQLDLVKIMQSPKKYIKGKRIRALVIYDENIFKVPGTKIKRGISRREKEVLLQAFHQRFPHCTYIPLCKNITINQNDELFPLYIREEMKEITLELWSSQRLTEIEKILFEEGLILEKRANHSYILNSKPQIILNIVTYNPKIIKQHPYRMDYCHKYKEDRIQSVIRAISSIPIQSFQTSLSLIEIEKCDGREKIDPKQVIREAFARTNRISQFIERLDGEEIKKEHIVRAIFSLLEKIGFRKRSWESMHPSHTYVSLSIEEIYNNQFVPILSKINEGEIVYKLYGSHEWRDFTSILLNVSAHETFLPQPSKRNDIGIQFKKYITEELTAIAEEAKKENKQVYFLIDASMREYWIESLQNEHMDLHDLPYISEEFQSLSNVTAIRINNQYDVPNYIMPLEKECDETELYVDQSGLYYSVNIYPLNDTGWKEQRILEIVVLGAKQEERDQIAKIITYMCKMSIIPGERPFIPFSMQMVKLIKKYITDIDLWQSSDELDTDWLIENE